MTRLLTTLSVAAMLTVAGCQTYPNQPSAGVGDTYRAPHHDPQIMVLEPELRPWLRFQPAAISMDADHPMTVEVPVRNLADRQYIVDYRIRFFDENDLEVDPTMGWQPITILPKQVARLQASAMSPEAVSYRLEVKWAQ